MNSLTSTVAGGEVRAFLADVGEDDVDVGLGDGTVAGHVAGNRLPRIQASGCGWGNLIHSVLLS